MVSVSAAALSLTNWSGTAHFQHCRANASTVGGVFSSSPDISFGSSSSCVGGGGGAVASLDAWRGLVRNFLALVTVFLFAERVVDEPFTRTVAGSGDFGGVLSCDDNKTAAV